jgi:hypothetical protein
MDGIPIMIPPPIRIKTLRSGEIFLKPKARDKNSISVGHMTITVDPTV